MGNSINYKPKTVDKVILADPLPEVPLVYTLDEETGELSETYEGYALRSILNGTQTLDNLVELNGVEDENGLADLIVNVWGTLRIVQNAGDGEIVDLVDEDENSLAVKSGLDSWQLEADKPLEVSYTGNLNLIQSLAHLITYDNVAFNANNQAVINSTLDEFALMSDSEKEVELVIEDTDSFTWTLHRNSINSDGAVIFSALIHGQAISATFTQSGQTVTGDVRKKVVAEGNTYLDENEQYDELGSATLDGVTYSVLTSAQAEQIAIAHGYTPTFATNTMIDLLFVSNTFALNSWDIIKAVCDAGQASNYWALGDTKTDVGTDHVVRTFRICDMTGMYGKHIVLEQVELEANNAVWNRDTNTDSDNCFNNYSISNMRTTVLPALLLKYSTDLQGIIGNTSYKVATNGLTTSAIVELSDKLFLPAEVEIVSSRNFSSQAESSELTRYALYALTANNIADFRKKYKSGETSASSWWLRSPSSGFTNFVCHIFSSGNASYDNANTSYIGYAPVFAL